MDWPKHGVQYMNTVELCNNPAAFGLSVDWFCDLVNKHGIKDIFAADARGFIWGAATALRTKIPMYTVRKKGKMPGDMWSQEYELEYGTDILELAKAVPSGDRPVLIIDDVLATGGTVVAIAKMLKKLGIKNNNIIVGVVVNLTFLNGTKTLTNNGYQVEGIVNV